MLPSVADLADLLEEAGALALAIGPESPRRKRDGSWVTDADVRVGALLRSRCMALMPGSTAIEEEGGGALSASLCWAIDPIDGTGNFRRGDDRWCVSVALLDGGRPALAGIRQPGLERSWLAGPDGPTFGPSAGVVAGVGLSGRLPPNPVRLARAARSLSGALRLGGSTAMDLVDVACGRLARSVSLGSAIWDIAAGWLLVEASGGLVTRWPVRHRWDVLARASGDPGG